MNLFRAKVALSAFIILTPISLTQSLFLLSIIPRYQNSLTFLKAKDIISVLPSFPSNSIIFYVFILIFKPTLMAVLNRAIKLLFQSSMKFSKIFKSSAKPSNYIS